MSPREMWFTGLCQGFVFGGMLASFLIHSHIL